MNRILTHKKTIKRTDGFTLLETLLAVALLGLVAYGISGLYFSGMQSLDEEELRILLDSRLRGRMEILVGNPFDQVVDGSEVVSVNGRDYTIAWTVALVDLNGDSTPESNAKQVTVSLSGTPNRSLTTILVDNQGLVGKI
jgi:prepilin-type N-terminal cleavage/methylation domain-containing protein